MNFRGLGILRCTICDQPLADHELTQPCYDPANPPRLSSLTRPASEPERQTDVEVWEGR